MGQFLKRLRPGIGHPSLLLQRRRKAEAAGGGTNQVPPERPPRPERQEAREQEARHAHRFVAKAAVPGMRARINRVLSMIAPSRLEPRRRGSGRQQVPSGRWFPALVRSLSFLLSPVACECLKRI